jgi:hypothetical protein
MGSEVPGDAREETTHIWRQLSWLNGRRDYVCETCPHHYRHEYDEYDQETS